MWYATEHAYGALAVNTDGPRPDRHYQFTARRLRDAWVAEGPPNLSAPGARTARTARELRRAIAERDVWDGDTLGCQALARRRVEANPALARHADILVNYDWGTNDHWRWVATAPEREIVAWACDTERAAESV